MAPLVKSRKDIVIFGIDKFCVVSVVGAPIQVRYADTMTRSVTDISASGFKALFLAARPLLDVRAGREFARGAIPAAVNQPILNDTEREQVGLCYKEYGQEKAIALGHEFVNGTVREQRVAQWSQLAKQHDDLVLYCWRGGLRSQLAQQWLFEAGYEVPRIEGGYKALRSYLLDMLQGSFGNLKLLRIGGRTGSGKTALLHTVGHCLDLEKHANHRGSSFGRRVEEPASQADFENRLVVDLIQRHPPHPDLELLVEDEGRLIGPLTLPTSIFDKMRTAPMAVVEMSMEMRVDNVLTDYVLNMRYDYETADPESGFERFTHHLFDSLARIKRRLGDENYRRCESLMQRAFRQQLSQGKVSLHCEWIKVLLESYYDPMYDYQLSRQIDQIIFRGSWEEVRDWAQARLP